LHGQPHKLVGGGNVNIIKKKEKRKPFLKVSTKWQRAGAFAYSTFGSKVKCG
jgi:hypothetical protein